MTTDIKPWQAWRHQNGETYVVLCLSNSNGFSPGKPSRVIYFNLKEMDTFLTGELSTWHRVMTYDPNIKVGLLLRTAVLKKLIAIE